MSNLFKTTALSLGLLTGVAFAAQAQSSSVASLPPGTTAAPPAATAPVGPTTAYPGPNPGSGYYGGTVSQQQPVTPSPQYVGPAPGSGYYGTPQKFDKPAGWENNAANTPYTTTGMGPRPN